MWNFQDFSATQILREINLVILKPHKTAILTICAALNFEFGGTFDIVECEIIQKIEI